MTLAIGVLEVDRLVTEALVALAPLLWVMTPDPGLALVLAPPAVHLTLVKKKRQSFMPM